MEALNPPYHVGLLAINTGVVEIGDKNARRVCILDYRDYVANKNILPTANKLVLVLNTHDELLLAAKEAAVMLADIAKVHNIKIPISPGFVNLMHAIAKAEGRA